jgi:hypothetical protein
VEEIKQTPVGSLEIELEPIDPGQVKGPGEDQAHVSTFLGKCNRVRLGRPRVGDYLAELRAVGAALPEELTRLIAEGGSVLVVRPTITLLPDRGCVFTDVDFTIELIADPVVPGAWVERPLAYAVRPERDREELPLTHTGKRGEEISAETGTSLGKLTAKITRENAYEDRGGYYTDRVYGHGTGFYVLGWHLRATRAAALTGDRTDLEAVVQVPAGATLSGRFGIAAEIAVEAAPDRWLTRAFGPRRTNLVLEAVYALRP